MRRAGRPRRTNVARRAHERHAPRRIEPARDRRRVRCRNGLAQVRGRGGVVRAGGLEAVHERVVAPHDGVAGRPQPRHEIGDPAPRRAVRRIDAADRCERLRGDGERGGHGDVDRFQLAGAFERAPFGQPVQLREVRVLDVGDAFAAERAGDGRERRPERRDARERVAHAVERAAREQHVVGDDDDELPARRAGGAVHGIGQQRINRVVDDAQLPERGENAPRRRRAARNRGEELVAPARRFDEGGRGEPQDLRRRRRGEHDRRRAGARRRRRRGRKTRHAHRAAQRSGGGDQAVDRLGQRRPVRADVLREARRGDQHAAAVERRCIRRGERDVRRGLQRVEERVELRLRGNARRRSQQDVPLAAHAQRGERYVLLAAASRVPAQAEFDALLDALESAPYVALAAPDAAALDGGCVLIAAARFPQHVGANGSTLAEAVDSLVAAAGTLRRAVRVPGFSPAPPPAPRARSATIVLAAASAPEILRLTATALVEATRGSDELLAAVASGATTTRRILAAFGQLRIVDDAVDPLLADAVNRAAGAARGELVVIVADDVLLTRGALDRMRDAFARVPALGAAFPAVPGALGGEGVADVEYADLAQLHGLAERRALERARELEPIDVAVTPALAVAAEAFAAVGGIDPAHGPTRRGIADLVTRLRSAGYAVVRCDDALVHRFEPARSHNPAATADLRQAVPAADPAAIARGFDPARRVPFVRASGDVRPAGTPGTTHAIALAVADSFELERAAAFLGAAAAAFDAAAPVRVHLLLDGTVSAAEAVARIRPDAPSTGRRMEETLAVRVERGQPPPE